MPIESLFLVLIGVLLLAAGVSSLDSVLRFRKPDSSYEGTVLASTLRTQIDEKERLIQRYYSLDTNYTDEKGARKTAGIRSTEQYYPGDPIRLMRQNNVLYPYIRSGTDTLSSIFLILSGVMMVITELLYVHVSMKAASLGLAGVFACLAVSLFRSWYRDSRLHLIPEEGTISELLCYREEKQERTIFRTNTWYPVITYERDGRSYSFLSRNGEKSSTSFKVGKKVSFFFDPEAHCVLEKKAGPGTIAAAGVMAAIAAYGLIATLIG